MIARDRGVDGLQPVSHMFSSNALEKKQSQDPKLDPKQPGRAHEHTHILEHTIDPLLVLGLCKLHLQHLFDMK